MNSSICRVLILVFFIFLDQSWASNIQDNDLFKGIKSDEVIYRQYLKRLESLHQGVCKPRIRRRYQKLHQNFQKYEVYIPLREDESLDREAVQKLLPLMDKKITWIEEHKEILRSRSWGKNKMMRKAKNIRRELNQLLKEKERQILLGKKVAKLNLNALKKVYSQWMSNIKFLQNFSYPVDHFKNRQSFEEAKAKSDHKRKTRLYLKRKVYEDGPIIGKRSDIYLRTALDSVQVRLNRNEFHRELVDDLIWVLDQVGYVWGRGKSLYFKGFQQWLRKAKFQRDYYKNLLGGDFAREELNKKQRDRQKLKLFVLEQQKKIFQRVSGWPELYRALFVFDQILLLEVGAASNENYRERQDIVQVIRNRKELRRYYSLNKDQNLYKELPVALRQKFLPWLGLMFRLGEFSFTHYFIPSVKSTFCIDFYKTAKRTRRKNMFLVLNELRKKSSKFMATRYFSRISMVGKIHMKTIWHDYKMLPYLLGRKIRHDRKLENNVYRSDYQYIDSFWLNSESRMDILDISGRRYFVNRNRKDFIFYNYRDPDKFTFFIKR